LHYCDNGVIEIDNSAAERALRNIAIGRRNYLLAGADSGGERAAAIFSLIVTVKLNRVDPDARFRQVLTQIAVNRVDELLPGTAAAGPACLNNTQLRSGVMPSPIKSTRCSRRWWHDAYFFSSRHTKIEYIK
jgi:hypothetical protein